ALDDSNVGRFASYLQKLTKNTQFIRITHRRGTMNAADRLYGITMQEKGVSTLVSVDLVENQLSKYVAGNRVNSNVTIEEDIVCQKKKKAFLNVWSVV
ncbi:hypothetical protein PZH33_21435, partial [Blautia schinkii]